MTSPMRGLVALDEGSEPHHSNGAPFLSGTPGANELSHCLNHWPQIDYY